MTLLSDLAPRKDCKTCNGTGIIRVIHPKLDAKLYRVLKPCHCVGKLVEVNPDGTIK